MFNRALSPRTIEYMNALLQSAFHQAVRSKMLGEDPCVAVDLPPLKRREMDGLSVEECRRFITVARESEWYALFALALTTGMRPSEYLALKWRDSDWQRGTASACRTIQTSPRVEHVEENAGAGALELTETEIARIDKAFPLGAEPRELPTLGQVATSLVLHIDL